MTTAIRQLNLNDLKVGFPGISPTVGAYHAEACLVCLDRHNHPIGIILDVQGFSPCTFQLEWDDIITDQIRYSWDNKDPTSQGACGIAALLIRELTPYTIVARSYIGTGFDYYLADLKNFSRDRNPLIFQNAARLEVSGIFEGSDSIITDRVNEKLKQTNPSDGVLPAYIVVVEFGRPVSHVVEKNGSYS